METSRELLNNLVFKSGFNTQLFNSVDDFLRCEETFDLVITDIAMPHKDGNDLLKGLLSKNRIPPQLLIVSAAIEHLDETVIEKIKPHTNLYKIEKPIKKDAFNLVLREVRHFLSGNSENSFELDILVVEDNLVNMEISKTMLERKGVRVTSAYNGKEAVDYCSEKDFDMILMDMNMPIMDGISATSIIRQDLELSTPIIALTANAYEEDKQSCLDVGMNDFMSKPLREFDLLLMIKKHIHHDTSVVENEDQFII